MNALEDLIRRDLEATALQVTVGDEDLMHAEHRYLRRKQQLVRRRLSWTAVGAAAATVVIVGGATVAVQELFQSAPAVSPAGTAPESEPASEPETLPLTRSNLRGIWMTPDSSGWLWSFGSDTRVTRVNANELDAEDLQANFGSAPYGLTPLGFTQPSDKCDFDASIDATGHLHVKVVRAPETCAFRMDESMSLLRLSPVSPAGASMTATTGAAAPKREPVRWSHELRGAWLQQGTGTLLLVGSDGPGSLAYLLDGDGGLFSSAADQGTVDLDDSGNLVLTSSTESAGCLPGSQVVVTDVQRFEGDRALPLGKGLDVTSVGGLCDMHQDLGGIWIRVS